MGERGDIDGLAAQRRGIGRSSDGRGVAADGCGSATVHEGGEVGDGEWAISSDPMWPLEPPRGGGGDVGSQSKVTTFLGPRSCWVEY
jgi:hypothetical protein